MLREREALIGVRPGSEPAHTSSVIGYTTQRDAIRMRFPYLRQAAPDVLATARAQRWDPAEVLRILLEAEIKGRDEATRRNHRKQANLPTGKTFDSWKETDSSIPLLSAYT